MGAIGAIAAASAIQTIGSAYTQSRAIKSQGQYERGVANINAGFSTLQAEDALARGEQDATAYQRQGRQLIGAQRARMAAQGLDLESGSALDVQEDTAAAVAQDVVAIRTNAWREAFGYRMDALNYKYAGQFAMSDARNRARSTALTAGIQIADTGLQAYGYAKQLKAIGGKTP